MHYFKRNIGDYHKKAGRLSMLEHGAYTLLIDSCYDREKFPTREEALEWCWARSEQEIAAVDFVLARFFDLVDGRYVQSRIQDEIDDYHTKANKNKEIALAREAARKAAKERFEHEPCTNEHEPPPNQEPLTINQEPLTNIKISSPSENVPVQELVELFNKSFPELPKVKLITDKRRTAVRKRWLENKERMPTLERWEAFFQYVRGSDFLMGRTAKPWEGFCFDWLMTPSNFVKILEGNYHGKGNGQ